MAAQLVIKKNGVKVLQQDLDSGQEYVLGRGSNCQITLDHPEISRQHLRLTYNGELWHCEVLSKFGTILVNGYPMASFDFSNGTVCSIPPFEIVFQQIEESPLLDGVKPEQDEIGDPTNVSPILVKPMLTPEPGQSYSNPIELTHSKLDEGIIIGRSSKCDIKIDHSLISRQHIKITHKDGVFAVENLAGKDKAYINDKPFKNADISSGDRLDLGSLKFTFEVVNPEFENLPAPLEKTEVAVVKFSSSDFPAQFPGFGTEQPPSQVAPPAKARKKKPQTGSPMFYGILVLLAGVLLFGLLQPEGNAPPKAQKTMGSQAGTAKVFDNLPPDQQRYVEEQYNLAINLYKSGRYEVAALTVEKIFQYLPNDPKAKELLAFSQNAIEEKRKIELEERRKREYDDLQQKIYDLLVGCQKVYSNKQYERIEECVSPVYELDPENATARDLVARANQAIDQKMQSREARAEAARKSQVAKNLFSQAQRAMSEKKFPTALNLFRQVASIDFTDKEGVKDKSRSGIEEAKRKIKEASSNLAAEGRKAYESKDYKLALQKLSQAMQFDPSNGDAVVLMSRLQKEMNNNLKTMYQEAVVEEGTGDIDKAVSKWRAIIDLAPQQNEYFKKAKMKLSKYEK